MSFCQVSPTKAPSVPPNRVARGPRPHPVHSCSVNVPLGDRYVETWPEEPAPAWKVEDPGELGEVSGASLHSSYSRSEGSRSMHFWEGGWAPSRQNTCVVCKSMSCLVLSKLPIVCFRSVQLFSHVRLFVTPWTAARQTSLSITNSRSLVGDAIQPSHPLSSPSPLAFNLFQHHGLFK